MDCQTTQAILLDPRDPGVDRAQLLEAASHTLACEECRSWLEEIGRLESTLRTPDDRDIELPRGGYPGLEDRLSTPRAKKSATFPRLAAAAAILVLVAGGYMAGLLNRQPMIAQNPNASAAGRIDDARVGFSTGEVWQSSRAFTAVSDAFDQQAAWLWTTDGALEVGIDPTPVDPAQSVFLFRLVNRSGGQVISHGELVIVSGRDARLSLPLPQGKQVRYVVHARTNRPEDIQVTAQVIDANGTASASALLASVAPTSGDRSSEMTATAAGYEMVAAIARTNTNGESP